MTETFLMFAFQDLTFSEVFFYSSCFYMPTVYEQQSNHQLSWFRFVFLKGRHVVVSEIQEVVINIK